MNEQPILLNEVCDTRDWSMLRQVREASLHEYWNIKTRFTSADPRVRPVGTEYDRLTDRLLETSREYAACLPLLTLGRCPFCGAANISPFDPWGFDGFWWIPRKGSGLARPKHCEHFRVLRGAVDTRGKPITTGPLAAQLGPDVPYVIPRLLELPTMIAVVHSLEMVPGFLAYPISYFSEVSPPNGSLTQNWTEQGYSFIHMSGRSVWTIKTDPWDFELGPWINRGLVRWTIPANPDALLAPISNEQFPYFNPDAVRLPQTAWHNELGHEALPSNQTIDPFE